MGRARLPATEPVERFFHVSLLGMLASGYLALAGSGYLDLPATVFTGAGLVLRALLVFGVIRLEIPARWINAATLAYAGFYPIDYLYLSREFIPATVHLICFLAVVRILSAQTNRDYFFVKVIAFLEILAATLLSSNMNFFVFLILFIVFGVATFCCSEIRKASERPHRRVGSPAHFHRRLAALTASITLGILIMTAGLFFLLPRTARAALRTLVPERYHLAGFSNEVALGQIGEIKRQSNPVMHVRIDEPDERLALKWRGAALSQFDGKRWYNPTRHSEPIQVDRGTAKLVQDDQRRRKGVRISYEVKLKAIGSDALFFAGHPEWVRIGSPLLFRSPGGAYRTGLGSSEGTHYFAISYRTDANAEGTAEPLREDDRIEHLLLPAIDRRIIELARSVGAGLTAEGKARAIENHLRTSYGYTTELLSHPVDDPMAHFLFERRRGHCEYFASAMAVMLRVVYIPSRVVTGFQSGTYNPMTGWHVIRSSDAHSWVEAYLPGKGWTTFDPTPPDNTRNAVSALWTTFSLWADAADMFWQQWVVQYNLEQQLSLAQRVERSSRILQGNWFDRSRESIGRTLASAFSSGAPYVGTGAVVLILVALGTIFGPRTWKLVAVERRVRKLSRGAIGASDAAILYSRMLDLMRRRGYEKPAWLTPSEFSRILPPSPTSALVEEFTLSYHELRYGGRLDAGTRMLRLLREIESQR
jgi:transglutaminase-like putative cysteine protease